MTTVLTEHGSNQPASASATGDALWLSADDVEQTLCWTLKPEGLCQGDTCIPVPKNDAENYVDGDKVNVAAFWQLMDRPVLHDDTGETWMLGAGHGDRGQSLQSLEAPDFTLPDLNGDMHSLSDFRGKRVFLTTWSSW